MRKIDKTNSFAKNSSQDDTLQKKKKLDYLNKNEK